MDDLLSMKSLQCRNRNKGDRREVAGRLIDAAEDGKLNEAVLQIGVAKLYHLLAGYHQEGLEGKRIEAELSKAAILGGLTEEVLAAIQKELKLTLSVILPSIPQPDSGNPKYSEVFRSDPQSKNISRPNCGSKRAMKTPVPMPNDTYFLPYQRAWIEDPMKNHSQIRVHSRPFVVFNPSIRVYPWLSLSRVNVQRG